MDLMKEIFEKAKNFLLNPKGAFDSEKKTDFIEAFKYCLVWIFISTILSSIVFIIFRDQILGFLPLLGLPGFVSLQSVEVGISLISFVGSVIGGILGLALSGLWLHLWVYLFGGRNNLENTLKAVFYGNTPTFVLGWIPIISFFASIWSLILSAVGLMKLQNLSLGRTIGVFVVGVLIPLVVISFLVASMFVALSGINGMAVLPF